MSGCLVAIVWSRTSSFSSMLCHVVNCVVRWPPTHRDGRLDPARLTKSPSCNCRGCSLPACLLCQTCGECCRHRLYQTAKTDGGEDEGGDDCEKDKDGLKTDAGVYHVSCDRAFSSEKYKAAGLKACCWGGCHTWEIWIINTDMTAVVLLSREFFREVKIPDSKGHTVLAKL